MFLNKMTLWRMIVRALVLGSFLLFAIFVRAGTGPNFLPNSGFEGGNAVWKTNGPFTIVNDPTNAHTGSWELQAALTTPPAYKYCYQQQDVWQNTDYLTTIWVKGSGTLVLGVLNTKTYQAISTVNVAATSTWQQVTLPWNSGTYGNVWVFLYDTVTGNATGTVYLDDCQTCLANGSDIQFDPTNPSAFGYSLVFDEEFNSAGSIDVNHSGAPGFNWYVGQYFGIAPTPSSMYSVGGGAFTVLNNPPESGMTIHTTEPDSQNGKGFHGTVFTAGAGIYIEARIALPNINLISGSSWPSFWSEDLKLETGLNEQMPGNPANYEHIEEDFMEYNTLWGPKNSYFSTIHDISGTFAPNGPTYNLSNSNNQLPVPVGTDFSQWHTYGLLWVPASAANGWIGYRQPFFDGVAQDATCWQSSQSGTAPAGSTTFSLKDQDQFDLIFGGSATNLPSMNVDYVHVYAVSPSSVTVVPPGPPGTAYGSSNVSVPSGSNITLTFLGLPGNPSGAVYVWYLNGTVVATTTTPTYNLPNALASQSGTYSVYAWAPGTPTAITGNESFVVTITDPTPPPLATSTGSVVAPDGSSVPFTVSLASAPVGNVTIAVAIAGSPAITVSPATITMTPTNYQNIPVTVTAAAINSNDANRAATVTLSTSTSSVTVGVTDPISDAQIAPDLTATAFPLTGRDLGVTTGDSSVRASGDWWIDGSGRGGITTYAGDSFHFESQVFTGDFQMVVQLKSLTAFGATSPLAGLMIRDGSSAIPGYVSSNFVALAGQSASGGYTLVQRTTFSGTPSQLSTGAPVTYTYPNAWLMLSRSGNVIHAFASRDSFTYTEITNPSTGITWTGMSTALNIGVFVSSASAANARAVMNNFSIATPPAFTDQDIGNPAHAGSATLSGGNITVTGGGSDIWGGSDQFNYYSEPLTGNSQSLVVHVDSVTGADAWAKGGVMFRNSNTATSPFVHLSVVPSHQVAFQWRDTESGGAAGFASNLVGDNVTLKWLMLTKNGSTFTAYYATTTAAPTPSDWVLAGTHTTTFAASTYLGGLAVTGHNNSVVGTSVFDSLWVSGTAVVSVAATPPPPPPPPPNGFTDADIGSPAHAGSVNLSGNNITINGGGNDIWNTSDQFNYYSESLTGDVQSIVVHVDSVTGADVWAKGGAMFRDSNTTTSPFVAFEAVPSKQVTLQWRDTEGANASSQDLVGDTINLKWLLLTKNGTTFTAYYATTTATPASSDWILAGTHTTTFPDTTYLAGLAVTGHNNSAIGTSIFDNLSVTAATVVTPPAPPVVTGYVDTDIGSPAVAGSAVINGGILTVNGGGADIWGNSDQFNYYYQQNTTDQTLIVHVETVQNTNTWAKGGIMFRNSTTATSPFVVLEEVPNRQVSFQWRDTEGGGANSQAPNLVGDTTSFKWLELVKSGNTFTAYYATTTAAPTATDWILVGTHTTMFSSASYLGGLSVTSHNNAVLGSTSFDSLSQQTNAYIPPKPPMNGGGG